MSSYSLELPEIGTVKVTKRRGMRSLRLRINPKGEILVSAPWAIPKPYITKFIEERREWIVKNSSERETPLRDGMYVGKNIQIHIQSGTGRNHSKISSKGLEIKLSETFDADNKSQQAYIEKRVINAMQIEAEHILLPRLDYIAQQTNHEFNQAYIKRLTSRWGSCDQQKNIILNVFLLQLPDDLQDYVILHELTHTKYMNHSADFWNHMEAMLPNIKQLRKAIKSHRPRIEPRWA